MLKLTELLRLCQEISGVSLFVSLFTRSGHRTVCVELRYDVSRVQRGVLAEIALSVSSF